MGGKNGKMWQHGFAVFAGCGCHDDGEGDIGEEVEGREVRNHDDHLPGRRDASRATGLVRILLNVISFSASGTNSALRPATAADSWNKVGEAQVVNWKCCIIGV